MFSNLTIFRLSRKLLAGLLMAVTVATSFLLALPEPALSSTPVTIPVTVVDQEGNPITGKKFKIEYCHEGRGYWFCEYAETNLSGEVNVSVSLPNNSGFVQLSAGVFSPRIPATSPVTRKIGNG